MFGRDDADVVVLYHSAAMTVNDHGIPAGSHDRAGRVAARRRDASHDVLVDRAVCHGPADRHLHVRDAQLAGADDQARQDTYKAIEGDLAAEHVSDGITAQVGGNVPTEVAITSEVTSNIARAEGISLPVLLILLIFIFGSVVAASLCRDRRAGHPRLVHRAAAAHLVHPGSLFTR